MATTTIIAAESDSIVVGQIATMVRELEASKIKVREAEAHYETIRDAILSTMVEHKIEGSISTVYGMVTHVKTPTWEYKDSEVTKQTKAVEAAKRTMDNLKKLLKAAQLIAQNNKKAKVVKEDHSLRYIEPK